ncbi:hypothetical protein ACFQNJ_15020 [Hydrogenophaga bisanensis]|uniref:Uncharacterized protein n=1 Tax=Hydrogenophaga bisanensis TaxID=439611 RepID=A0ABW2RCP4_9BURK
MTPEKRLARLKELLERLERGVDVATRDLKIVLTPEEWEQMQEMWKQQKEVRAAKPPPEIVEFQKKKKLYDLTKARLEKSYRTKNQRLISKMSDREDCMRDSIIVDAKELLGLDPTYEQWFHWDDIGLPSGVKAVDDLVPQVVSRRTMKGELKKYAQPGKLSKRDIKVIVLQDAISNLTMESLDEQSVLEDALKQLKDKKPKRKRAHGIKV